MCVMTLHYHFNVCAHTPWPTCMHRFMPIYTQTLVCSHTTGTQYVTSCAPSVWPQYGKTNQDFVTFLKPYCTIPQHNLDLSKPDHVEGRRGITIVVWSVFSSSGHRCFRSRKLDLNLNVKSRLPTVVKFCQIWIPISCVKPVPTGVLFTEVRHFWEKFSETRYPRVNDGDSLHLSMTDPQP